MRIMFSLLMLSFLALTLCGCPARQVTDAADDTAQSSVGAGAGGTAVTGGGSSTAKPKIVLATTRFKVEGMTCADCSKSIESELIGIEGVTTVSADDKSGSAIVQYDASKVQPAQLIAAIESLKFRASLAQDGNAP
jgi:copper chaperone CopZ